jgi:hypothetical protein
MYWVERDSIPVFKKKTADGSIITLLKGKFKDIRWMHVTKTGTLYFIDLFDLYKIDTTGKLKLIAKNISDNTPTFGMFGGKHSLMGIWTDTAENIYVANLSGQVVKKITQRGEISAFIYSVNPWSPTGGIFDEEGNCWLLETSLTNAARVRKIAPSAFNRGIKPAVVFNNYILPVAIVLVVIMAVIFLFRLLFIRKKIIAAKAIKH